MSLIDRICRKTVNSASDAIRENVAEDKTKLKEKLIEAAPVIIGVVIFAISMFSGDSKPNTPDVHINVTVNLPPVTNGHI